MPEKKADMPQELPYERLLRFGPENLTEAELLAVIIRTGTKEKSALQLAEQVLRLAKYPREGLLGLHEVSLEELEGIKGIGQVKAVKLKCIAELSVRMSTATASKGVRFTSSRQVAAYFMEKLRHRDTEGSVRSALISPRELFLEALDARAVNMLLVHNHPSGDPTPSRSDMEITSVIREMGEKMDIPLLDHIVIGDNRYVSFRESSWFTGENCRLP